MLLRKLLGKLCTCVWTCLQAEARRLLGRDDAVPGMVAADQTFGELLHWQHSASRIFAGVDHPPEPAGLALASRANCSIASYSVSWMSRICSRLTWQALGSSIPCGHSNVKLVAPLM